MKTRRARRAAWLLQAALIPLLAALMWIADLHGLGVLPASGTASGSGEYPQERSANIQLPETGVKTGRRPGSAENPSQSADYASRSQFQVNPLVAEMMAQVTVTAVREYAGALSGEWPVVLYGQPLTLATRHTYGGEPISIATRYAGEQLSGLGLAVQFHQWDDITNPNVIASIPGEVRPVEVFILSAHLDSTSADNPYSAPGADDNASGSTAVLVAAQILSQYRWACTLRFALWTGEEQGLRGSRAYAEQAAARNEAIAGVLNLDMIGYSSGSPAADIHATSAQTGSIELANVFLNAVSEYSLDLQPELVVNSSVGSRSDNGSFWENGYEAILVIEDYQDFNPHYHTGQDLLANLNLPYFTEMVRAAVAAFVHMSGCLLPAGTGQLQGQILSAGDSTPIAGAQVFASDSEGGMDAAEANASGYFSKTLATGAYTVTAAAAGYFSADVSHVDIVSGTVTTTDFQLIPWPSTYLPVIALAD